MIRLHPEWIGELVSMCARDNWADTTSPLDYPTISPMWRKLLPESAESEDVGGYSSAELRACKAGIEHLSKMHPLEYTALRIEFQRRRHDVMHENHRQLVLRAGQILAKFVDDMCG